MKANRIIVASVGVVLTLLVGILLLAGSGSATSSVRKFPKGTPTPSRTVILPAKGTPPTNTPTRTPTLTATNTLIPTDTPTPVDTVSVTNTPTDVVETLTPTPTNTAISTSTSTPTTSPPSNIAPYPSAPLCLIHNNSTYHGLWNYADGCHYDHEHGQNPFTSQIAAVFPGFDLQALLGGVGVGHTNPSGPMENTHKHGGFKWTISIAPFSLPAPTTCVVGFENAQNCITAAVIQYHQYGDANLELEVHDGARIHSANALIRMGPLSDPGYAYVVQHIEYGEIAASYQGALVPYPENFLPAWNPAFGQYWTTPCIGSFFNIVQSNCLSSLEAIRAGDADNIVTSKVTSNVLPVGPRPPGSELFKLLWRARDAYQALDAREELIYPFTYLWICSNDGGVTYNPVGCRYNNSTGRVHEIGGTILASWDNLAGFDSDARFGRITAEGFVTRFGTLNLGCVVAGPDCFPIKLVSAYVGTYGGTLSSTKISDTNPSNTPERDIYFCGLTVCNETVPGAISSLKDKIAVFVR